MIIIIIAVNPNPNLNLWLFNSKTVPYVGYPKVTPYSNFEHFGTICFWVMHETNRRTQTSDWHQLTESAQVNTRIQHVIFWHKLHAYTIYVQQQLQSFQLSQLSLDVIIRYSSCSSFLAEWTSARCRSICQLHTQTPNTLGDLKKIDQIKFLDRNLVLKLICINFSSDNKCSVLYQNFGLISGLRPKLRPKFGLRPKLIWTIRSDRHYRNAKSQAFSSYL